MAAAIPTVFDPFLDAIADRVAARIAPAQRTKRLLTTAQAAEYLGVGTDTVKRLHAAGKLVSVDLLKRNPLFDIDDLDAIIVASKEVR